MKDEENSSAERKDLALRTKQFALRVIKASCSLPNETAAQVLGKQMLRSGTSVGAQYREAKRAKSDADFVSKVEGALQELEETGYWLELLGESGVVTLPRLRPLLEETDELLAILTTIAKKAKGQ